MGELRTLTSIVVNTRLNAAQWVSYYTLSYSHDSVTWYDVTDGGGQIVMFEGNYATNVAKENEFEAPLYARYVTLYPKTWYKLIMLRWGLNGCPYGKKYLCAQ